MWVSPRAAESNARAEANNTLLENCAKTGINPETNKLATLEDCEVRGLDGEECGGEMLPILWYDPFSDLPKGLLFVCSNHRARFDELMVGQFFTCSSCGRVNIHNYTWESYLCHDEVGMPVCMRCYAREAIKDPGNWYDLNKQDYIHFDPINALDFEQVRHSKHLFPVECQDYFGLEFFGNVEFDSMSGSSISGGGVQGLKDLLRKARDEGHERAMLVVDGAYQFSVSIGVYVEGEEEEEEGE